MTLGGTGTGTLAAVLGNNGTGASSLIKNSTGTWTLTGANTYSGSTQVNQGKLVVHGALFGTANVNVGDGIDAATLSGNSPITLANAGAVTVASAAALAPDAGGLTINAAAAGTASLAFQSGSTLQLSIANSQSGTHGAPKLSDYSALTLGTGVTASLAGLLNTNVSGTVNNGDVFPILLSSTAVSGFFDNANGSSAVAVGPSTFRFTSGGQQWEINYAWTGAAPLTGEDLSTFAGVTGGTNVALLAIPEPGTPTAVLTGSALLLGWRRRRQR